MPIVFIDATNTHIDRLVKLVNAERGDHNSEALFVPARDEDAIDIIDDTPSEDEVEPGIIDFSGHSKSQRFSTSSEALSETDTSPRSAVVAVDSGVIDLGELATGGTVFAVRGAAVCYPPNGEQPFVCSYNTGALVIDQANKLVVFHYLGTRLGREDLFVEVSSVPPYYRAKQSMTETANQIQDRCRNFVERMIQEEAVSILERYDGGILLVDGALTGGGGTFDTPEKYMRDFLTACSSRRINVAAISKKTRITVAGRPISSLFSDQPGFIGHARLTTLLEAERQATVSSGQSVRSVQALSVAEDIYAARFGYAPTSLTFRVDVHPSLGFRSPEVLDVVYNYCQIYGGYPRPLIDAHQHSSFLYQDVQTLLADVTVRLGLSPQAQPSMEVLFQPFGGRYK